jgi:hypothetical protein
MWSYKNVELSRSLDVTLGGQFTDSLLGLLEDLGDAMDLVSLDDE